jgi:hypothetical protein
MRVFIPGIYRENFTRWLNNKVYSDFNSLYFSPFKIEVFNESYCCFSWEEEAITYGYFKETFDSFAFNWHGENIERVEYISKDGSIFIYNNPLTIINMSNSSLYLEKESQWKKRVSDLVTSLSFDFPFMVEFNPLGNTTQRVIPTISLVPKLIWINNGETTLSKGIQPIVFRNMANLIYFSNYVAEPERMSLYYNFTDSCIITPMCIIKKNDVGFGNTVTLRSVIYSDEETYGVKNIYSSLEEGWLWTNILIPLSTIDFDVLKGEFASQEIPMTLQLKLFKIQSQQDLQAEIMDIKANIALKKDYIRDYTKTITDCKVNIVRQEEILREKTNILEKRLVDCPLEDEFRRISSLPYVEKVSFLNYKMEVTTKPIQIDDGPFLGGYTIVYDVKTKDLGIINNVNPKHDLAHPHIYQNGEICFGNYSDVYFRFETGEYYVGLELLHEFLSSYNPDDEWGRRLIYWDAKYFFEDAIERDILDYVEDEWDDYYYALYNEHLPSMNYCEDCGRPYEDCTCHDCEYCGNHEDNCICWICPNCGERVEAGCSCNRCEVCNELIEDCECARCGECGELLDPNNYYATHCECDRCLEEYETYRDEDTCKDCESFNCEYNCNEDAPATQEESLFSKEEPTPPISFDLF